MPAASTGQRILAIIVCFLLVGVAVLILLAIVYVKFETNCNANPSPYCYKDWECPTNTVDKTPAPEAAVLFGECNDPNNVDCMDAWCSAPGPRLSGCPCNIGTDCNTGICTGGQCEDGPS